MNRMPYPVFVTIIVTSFIFGAVVSSQAPCYEPTTEKIQLELSAYRDCMQNAGVYGCRMTPQDFIRYYEIKNLLEQD